MSKKILLIEDTLEVRENTQEILELAGYEVNTAENGVEGVKAARSYLPNLIICDIMMPQLDGYGVIHLLSKDPETAAIPFIYLTAKADKTDIRKGMGLGADDYLTKPFDEKDLLETIERRLKKHELIQQSVSAVKDFSAPQPTEEFEGMYHKQGISEKFHLLSANRKERDFEKKDTLYREDDYAKFLYYIIEGKIKCSKIDEYGKELITHVADAGEYIGHINILKETEYSETATFIEKGKVAYIPKEDFIKLVHSDKEIAIHFIKELSGDILEKEEELLRLAFSPVRDRTAWALLKLYIENKEQTDTINALNREELASIVGTSTESLIRMLSEFKKEGLISIQEKKISLLDVSALKQMSQL